jgi:hypothetical protein
MSMGFFMSYAELEWCANNGTESAVAHTTTSNANRILGFMATPVSRNRIYPPSKMRGKYYTPRREK